MTMVLGRKLQAEDRGERLNGHRGCWPVGVQPGGQWEVDKVKWGGDPGGQGLPGH